MRPTAVSAFFLTFAMTIWVVGPPEPDPSGFQPIGPQHRCPCPKEPDLPPEALDAEHLASLNACANDSDIPAECRVASMRRLFTHYLRPPADLDRVRAVLSDTRWVA